MKKLLILGAGNYQLPLILKAKEMGVYTIAISPDGPYPGLKAADKVYYQDARDENKALEVAIKEQVDGVTTDQGELFVRAVAYVAENMGLPGIGYENARIFTNKYRMREKCMEMGIPTIDYKLVSSYDEALGFYRNLGGSAAIIKPIDSSGSRGVSKISSEEDLRKHFDEAAGYALQGEVIIERFIEGDEFEVDSIAAGGKSKTLMYADLESFDIPNIFASTTRLYPSVAPADDVNRLLELNQKIMDSFGLKVGLSHSEYMKDKNGQFYLIEAAARGGGTYISSHIAQLQSGLNTAEFLVKTALGEITEIPEFEANQCHCGYVAFYLPQGEVVSVEGISEVEALPYVAVSTLHLVKMGAVTKAFEDKRNRHAVILSADSREELIARIEHIRKILQIKIKTPEGIRGPIWH